MFVSGKLMKRVFSLSINKENEFFSKDYITARSRFLAALDSIHEKVDHSFYEVRSTQYSSLFLDTAHRSATLRKKKLFIFLRY